LTDYLEQQLDHADALLEQIRRMERSGSGLLQKDKKKDEYAENSEENPENDVLFNEKSEIMSDFKEQVDNLESKVDKIDKKVDDAGSAPETVQNKAETEVNQNLNLVDGASLPKQDANSSQEEPLEQDTGSEKQQSNLERAQNSPPLAVQLEELDRAVSAMAAALPAGWGAEAKERGYPVSLSAPGSPTAYPGVTGTAAGDYRPAGAAGLGSAPGAELGWAEQADRAFRRDSRRYDGGFYLY